MAKLKYDKRNFPLLAEGWARQGLSDKQIAKNLKISVETFYQYVKKYPEFSEALKKGKEPVDVSVENSLLKKAIGYEVEETITEMKIREDGSEYPSVIRKMKKHIQPDTGAIAFWLKNRRPDLWRENKSMDITTNGENINIINLGEGEKPDK